MPNHSLGTHARSSERVLLRIPIRVEGKDTFGNAFDEITHTLVINRTGGLIVVLHLLKPGAMIKITNMKTQVSCSFESRYAGRELIDRQSRVGREVPGAGA